MIKYQAVCTDENKILGKPQLTQALAQAIADQHSSLPQRHGTAVRTVVSGYKLEIADPHGGLDIGSVGEILSGPFGENEIFHVRFDNDDPAVKFRKVPAEKLK